MGDKLYQVKFGRKKITLRQNVIADYWVFEGLFFAEEYFPLKIKPNDIVLDVGANIGIFTCKIAMQVKNIISIEPEPRNFSILKQNVETNRFSNVVILNYAVSDREEIVHFSDTGGAASVSETGIPVMAKSLDTILDELGNPKVTILKMDIEGYEGKVLSNFRNHETINQVVIETHSRDLTRKITSILSSWGLTVTDISRIKRRKFFKNVLFHPFSFLSVERINNYSTLKQVIKYLKHQDLSPVAADNADSEQRVLYAFKQ
ncbi:FkbM family methyltransferase [Caldiplasma sukawensis]